MNKCNFPEFYTLTSLWLWSVIVLSLFLYFVLVYSFLCVTTLWLRFFFFFFFFFSSRTYFAWENFLFSNFWFIIIHTTLVLSAELHSMSFEVSENSTKMFWHTSHISLLKDSATSELHNRGSVLPLYLIRPVHRACLPKMYFLFTAMCAIRSIK